MSRRVVLGKKNSGAFGLSVSLAGIDALTADVNGGGFSFDDSWTDIVKIAMTGTVTVASSVNVQDEQTVSHGLGYVPFIESRIVSGSTINDDLVNIGSVLTSNRYSGGLGGVTSSVINFFAIQSQLLDPKSGTPQAFTGYSALYVVYAVPVPNPS